MSVKRYDMHARAERARQDASEEIPPAIQTLSPDELNLVAEPPKQPIPVLAWIRVNGQPVKVEAECVEFTKRCVLVRFTPPGRPPTQCWVYAGAVTKR
jgi:hypothetical protein